MFFLEKLRKEEASPEQDYLSSWFCILQAVWSWADDVTFLWFSFLIFKKPGDHEIEMSWGIYIKCHEKNLVHTEVIESVLCLYLIQRFQTPSHDQIYSPIPLTDCFRIFFRVTTKVFSDFFPIISDILCCIPDTH